MAKMMVMVVVVLGIVMSMLFTVQQGRHRGHDGTAGQENCWDGDHQAIRRLMRLVQTQQPNGSQSWRSDGLNERVVIEGRSSGSEQVTRQGLN